MYHISVDFEKVDQVLKVKIIDGEWYCHTQSLSVWTEMSKAEMGSTQVMILMGAKTYEFYIENDLAVYSTVDFKTSVFHGNSKTPEKWKLCNFEKDSKTLGFRAMQQAEGERPIEVFCIPYIVSHSC